jgi:phage baseplate assembly protein W
MADSFLGTGWQFKLGPDTDVGIGLEPEPGDPTLARVAEASEEAAVRRSIWLILSTAPGERIGRPDFGCRLHDLTFSTNGGALAGDAVAAVQDALATWEHRIEVLSVDAYPDATERNLLLIDVSYAISATNSRMNLVYPFYLS